MEPADAVAMLAPSGVGELGPATWADLGCGDGVFTRALASLLPAGSRIHAMDRDASSLRTLGASYGGVHVETHRGDFTRRPWPFAPVDGILMANALHYVADQPSFIRACAAHASTPPRFLIVEYDTERANRWVPYPIGRERLAAVFGAAGYASIRMLGSRQSIYRRAPLYAAAVAVDSWP